jgi:N-formylglutamate deformylase
MSAPGRPKRELFPLGGKARSAKGARTNAPFLLHAPTTAALPLVLDSPHSGEHYPDDFDHAPPRAIVRQAEDTHVARLYRGAPRFGATLIEAVFPRAYIDANRSLDDLDPAMLAEPWPVPLAVSRKTEQGIGLLWRVARGGAPMYERKLTVEEVQRRIDRWYKPYHAALAAEIDARHRTFGTVWHVNCHSMPAVGDANADDPGRARADFVLGDREGTTCEPEFTALVADVIRGLGYSVTINDPYKGVEIVRKHGRPAAGRHSLQIELNRRLYMDETTLEPNGSYAVLERDLERLVAAVASYVRTAIGKTT